MRRFSEKEYSGLKMLRHLDRVSDVVEKELIVRVPRRDVAPITVEFSLTNRCNLNCVWCCEAPIKSKYPTELPWSIVERTLTEMAEMGVKSIVFEGGGEPFMYSKARQALRHARHMGMQVGLITNGTLLWPEQWNVKEIVRSCEWVRISLDAFSPATFTMLKGSGRDVNDVMRGLRSLVRERHEAERPVIGASFLLHDENWKEAAKATQAVREAGADYMQLKPLIEESRRFRYLPGVEGEIKKAERLATEHFTVYACRFEADYNVRNYGYCFAHRLLGYVNANGYVYLCCNYKNLEGAGERFELENMAFGNLHDMSWTEIWTGDRRKRICAQVETEGFVDGCPMCRLNEQNEMLNVMMGKEQLNEFI